jgi:hypothetical protein
MGKNSPTQRAPEVGDCAASQAVFYSLAFFWLDGAQRWYIYVSQHRPD